MFKMFGKNLIIKMIFLQNWAFLARFCFLTEIGTFRYKIKLSGQEENLKLLLYYDASHQWPSVYPTNKTCTEKEAVLNQDQIISLSPTEFESSGCFEKDLAVQCKHYRRFRSSHPRWWFIALSDCASKTGLNVTYWISLTNAPSGTFWKEHFSADEFCK